MENSKIIFISYGRDTQNPQDVDLVRKVKKDLEDKGFKVLMDEEQLKTTDDWEIKLEEMILKSDWMLFFITPYSARRPEGYCLNELAMSLAYKIPIAPVMVSYEVPPLSICRVQYLDLQTLNYDGDYEEKLQELIDVISGEKELGFEGVHLRTLIELSPIKFEITIAKHIHGFTGREWVYEEVDNWIQKEKNFRALWIVAEAGFGKSAISTYLSKEHPSAMSVYFCQYDYMESKEAREMLKVLIYELSTQVDEYHKILQTLDVKEALKKSAEHIFTQLLLEPLHKINKPNKKHFFIIDALDEADINGTNEIVELIANRFLDLPSWLGIVITSRPEPKLQRKLKKFNLIELRANDKKNLNDLRKYLSKYKNLNDKNILDTLIRKSEGNILYLKSIFEHDMINEGELSLENIQEIPDSMDGFYLTYFERKFDDINVYEEKYLEFVSIIVKKKGIPELLLRDILGLDERAYQKIKNRFGSLLEVDGENLSFYHKSIYEWLSDYSKSGDYSADVRIGEKKIEIFMDSLTSETYKEEYLKFTFFNRMLMYRIFLQDGDLDRFHKIIKSVDKNKDFLLILGSAVFHNSRRIRANSFWQDIKYSKDASSWQWIEDYILELDNDQSSSFQHNDINLIEKSLIILDKLYRVDPNKWVKDYVTELELLRSSYDFNNKSLEYFELKLGVRR